MGKINPGNLLHPKSQWGSCLLYLLGVIALLAFAVLAWEPLFVCALIVAAFWIVRKLWRWLDRHLKLMERLRRLGERLQPLHKPLKIILVISLAPFAVAFFLESFWMAALCALLVGIIWGLVRLWRRVKPRISQIREHNFRIQDLSIQKAYVLYVLVAMVTATVICSVLINAVDRYRYGVYVRYADARREYTVPAGGSVDTDNDADRSNVYEFVIRDAQQQPVQQFTVNFKTSSVEYVYVTEEGGEPDREVEWYESYNRIYVQPVYSDFDRFMDVFLGIAGLASIPIVYVSAIVFCAMLFYRRKLKTPIAILSDAAGRIADNTLDFQVAYDARDEMGSLCDSFERMRAALQQNNAEMWRQMEERRRLNAAFSHDLRTPLTVLRGHADLLKAEIPDESIDREEILQEITAMSAHIGRLENYVSAMSRLQRLEDVEIHRTQIPALEFAREMRESAEILCGDKTLKFVASPGLFWNVDAEVVMQVFENLLSNAVRYARTTVAVQVEEQPGELWISVSDDGPGFSPEDLQKATEPFYRAEGSGEGHLGLGLNICRILCERHGGGVKVENEESGGARVRAWFSMLH